MRPSGLRGRVFWPTLFLTGWWLGAARADYEVTVPRCAAPPRIDGRLDDPCWEKAATLDRFVLLRTQAQPTQPTTVYLTFDAEHLYLGAICREDQMEALRAEVTERDGAVYEDDCFEVFLSPRSQPEVYYHLVVNVRNTQRDDLGADAGGWDASWRSATARGEDAWTVEIALPFSVLQIPGDVPETWAFNLAREERPHGELSTWAPCDNGFHEPGNFGRLRFAGADFRPYARETLWQEVRGLRQWLEQTQAEVAGLPAESALVRRVRDLRAAVEEQLRQVSSLLQRRETSQEELAQAQEHLNTATQRLQAYENLSQRLTLARAAAEQGKLPPYVVCAASPMTKVRPDQPYEGQSARMVQLYAARNEYEAAQFVLLPLGEDLQQVRVSARAWEWEGGEGRPALSPSLQINLVGYVNITQPSGRAQMGRGRFPDPLLPNGPFDVPAEEVRSVWVTVYVPPEAWAGDYRGTLTFTPQNAPAQSVELRLHVWDFTLPKASFLRTDFQINPHYVALRHGAAPSPHLPRHWTYGVWTGADVKGRPNYFGRGVFHPALEREEPHRGKTAVKITAEVVERGTHEGPRACYYTEPIALQPHTDYEVSGWYRSTGEGVAGVFTHPLGGRLLPASAKWRLFRRRFNSGDRDSCRVYVGIYAVGTAWFDDLALREAGREDAPNLVVNGDFEAGERMSLSDLLRAYRLNQLRHRMSDQNVAAPRITVAEDGTVTIDWTEFDAEIEFYLQHGLNAFNIHWARLPGGWGKVAEAGEKQRRIAAEILRQTQAHLAEKGWVPLGYIYVIDEPSARYFPQVKAAFQIVREAAPQLKTLLTFGYGATRPWRPGAEGLPAYAALDGYVDIWVPHTDCFDPEYLATQRRDNNEIWAYVCISAQRPYANIWGIDFPSIDPRILFWQLFRYDITGFLYWNTTYWKEDPWENPMTYPGGNADGSLFYPGEEGPVNSIRAELIREGIEDYDTLTLLRSLRAYVQDEALRRRIDRALDVTDVAATFTEYTHDPAVLEARRTALGTLVEEALRAAARP